MDYDYGNSAWPKLPCRFSYLCWNLTLPLLPEISNEAPAMLARSTSMNLFKSILHNIGVVIVGLGVAFIGTRVDAFFGISDFHSIFATALAWLLLVIGFLVRIWATFYFYERRMKVISLAPQKTLITSGPYRFSRNPLYLGGNVFIFFGAALLLGSPTALFITAIHLPFLDLFIRREEKQLEKDFGEEWVRYKKQVRRWI
jgi:protein-S-isoprenylcysteine O-methyltransferase Ste14